MTHPQFSPAALEERWVEISDFPGYSISDRGQVLNSNTNRMMTPTLNTRGIWIVGMMKNSTQHKKSISLLVASEFVPKPSHPMFKEFDTPIHLDGNVANNVYTNLTWRPLWFARKYKQQFTDRHLTFDSPIEDVETHIVYENSWAAALHHGLLDSQIFESMQLNTYVWPTGQIFRAAV